MWRDIPGLRLHKSQVSHQPSQAIENSSNSQEHTMMNMCFATSCWRGGNLGSLEAVRSACGQKRAEKKQTTVQQGKRKERKKRNVTGRREWGEMTAKRHMTYSGVPAA